MKILLRHTETGLYLQGPEKWTPSLQVAYDFRFIERAQQFIQIWELENVEIAFAFEDADSISALSHQKIELSPAA
jgi:hypothetical protein